jgi:hypothetical protein
MDEDLEAGPENQPSPDSCVWAVKARGPGGRHDGCTGSEKYGWEARRKVIFAKTGKRGDLAPVNQRWFVESVNPI